MRDLYNKNCLNKIFISISIYISYISSRILFAWNKTKSTVFSPMVNNNYLNQIYLFIVFSVNELFRHKYIINFV